MPGPSEVTVLSDTSTNSNDNNNNFNSSSATADGNTISRMTKLSLEQVLLMPPSCSVLPPTPTGRDEDILMKRSGSSAMDGVVIDGLHSHNTIYRQNNNSSYQQQQQQKAQLVRVPFLELVRACEGFGFGAPHSLELLFELCRLDPHCFIGGGIGGDVVGNWEGLPQRQGAPHPFSTSPSGRTSVPLTANSSVSSLYSHNDHSGSMSSIAGLLRDKLFNLVNSAMCKLTNGGIIPCSERRAHMLCFLEYVQGAQYVAFQEIEGYIKDVVDSIFVGKALDDKVNGITNDVCHDKGHKDVDINVNASGVIKTEDEEENDTRTVNNSLRHSSLIPPLISTEQPAGDPLNRLSHQQSFHRSPSSSFQQPLSLEETIPLKAFRLFAHVPYATLCAAAGALGFYPRVSGYNPYLTAALLALMKANVGPSSGDVPTIPHSSEVQTDLIWAASEWFTSQFLSSVRAISEEKLVLLSLSFSKDNSLADENRKKVENFASNHQSILPSLPTSLVSASVASLNCLIDHHKEELLALACRVLYSVHRYLLPAAEGGSGRIGIGPDFTTSASIGEATSNITDRGSSVLEVLNLRKWVCDVLRNVSDELGDAGLVQVSSALKRVWQYSRNEEEHPQEVEENIVEDRSVVSCNSPNDENVFSSFSSRLMQALRLPFLRLPSDTNILVCDTIDNVDNPCSFFSACSLLKTREDLIRVYQAWVLDKSSLSLSPHHPLRAAIVFNFVDFLACTAPLNTRRNNKEKNETSDILTDDERDRNSGDYVSNITAAVSIIDEYLRDVSREAIPIMIIAQQDVVSQETHTGRNTTSPTLSSEVSSGDGIAAPFVKVPSFASDRGNDTIVNPSFSVSKVTRGGGKGHVEGPSVSNAMDTSCGLPGDSPAPSIVWLPSTASYQEMDQTQLIVHLLKEARNNLEDLMRGEM